MSHRITLLSKGALLLWITFSGILALGQKQDYTWQFAYPYDTSTHQVNQLSFAADTLIVDSTTSNIWHRGTSLSISDSTGNLAFVSNGLLIHNAWGQPIAGSDSFNFRFNQFGVDYGGTYGKQGLAMAYSCIALPWPDSEGVYVILHQTCEEYPANFKTLGQYYTVVDMRANNGFGQVTKLNQILLDKHVEMAQASACRHSNGRDWWVLVKEAYPSNAYHRFLLTPTGWRKFEDVQQIGGKGYKEGTFYASNGVVYDPAGQQHIRAYPDGVYLFAFNRCTGLLSNYRKLPVIPTTPPAYPDYILSPSVSPNSRYLYICNALELIRYDLTAPDIFTTRDTVASWDGFISQGLPTGFVYAQLGPDNKIYINTSSALPWLQVVTQPDSADPVVLQHHIHLPEQASGLPIYPNYRLGQVPGNPCPSGGGIPMDTTTGVEPLPEALEGSGLRVQPNPATESVSVHLNVPTTGTLMLRTLSGQVLLEQYVANEATDFQLDLQQVAAGVYVLEFKDENGSLIFAKLCVQ